ncbi:Dimeric alpha-beta barrel [Penicillium verhagenii]|uniref:Dimeric alpha-beta barrel n=1 Tax=Penicillium verhagenii TaxID=1562060 RepID=UPI00254501C8|nr:Dimeric alpha-beta barrel [Penicillium verhagenii]KAJ5921057.1 Dimeric alpha-beta barrel [Penicillium verhagenii]
MDPLPKDHKFNNPEFDYSSTPNFQDAIKVSVFFRKRPDISYEQFFAHWQSVHCDLVLATAAFRSNVLRYVQVKLISQDVQAVMQRPLCRGLGTQSEYKSHCRQLHHTPEMQELSRSLNENVLEYDACAEIWVRTWDDWLKFSGSDEYMSALGEDCQRFMQLPMTYMVGRENLVMGDAFREIGGKHGFSKDGFSVRKI